VIVEPIMSGVGVAVPPDEYLPMVEATCRKYDVLLHVDEVINGFGRTGKNVRPPALRHLARHHGRRQGASSRLTCRSRRPW